MTEREKLVGRIVKLVEAYGEYMAVDRSDWSPGRIENEHPRTPESVTAQILTAADVLSQEGEPWPDFVSLVLDMAANSYEANLVEQGRAITQTEEWLRVRLSSEREREVDLVASADPLVVIAVARAIAATYLSVLSPGEEPGQAAIGHPPENGERIAWRQIESAPKDGMYILIHGSAGTHIAHWTTVQGSEYWWNFDCRGVGDPTHWMPVPSFHPPQETEP